MQSQQLKLVVLLTGIAVGIWHLSLALQALFIFRESEPITSWIAIATGPLTTLIATIWAGAQPKLGGRWLIGSDGVALFSFIVGEGFLSERTLQFALWISLPMAIIGVAFLWLDVPDVRRRQSNEA